MRRQSDPTVELREATAAIRIIGQRGIHEEVAYSRGQRIGHEPWNKALAAARRLDVRQLYLLTTTAENLFVRWGFRRMPRQSAPEVVRQTREYSAVRPSTAAVMVMDVSAARAPPS